MAMTEVQIMRVKNAVEALIIPEGTPTEGQTKLIDTAVTIVSQRLLRRIPKGIPFPDELEYLLVEASVTRFNLIGSEGYSAESVEGHSISLRDPMNYDRWYDEIDEWLEDNGYGVPKEGQVYFF